MVGTNRVGFKFPSSRSKINNVFHLNLMSDKGAFVTYYVMLPVVVVLSL